MDLAVGRAAGDEPLPDLLEGSRRRDVEADVIEVSPLEGLVEAVCVLVVLDLDQHERGSLAESDGDRTPGAGLGGNVDSATSEDVAVERAEPFHIRGQHGEVVEAADRGGS